MFRKASAWKNPNVMRSRLVEIKYSEAKDDRWCKMWMQMGNNRKTDVLLKKATLAGDC